MAGVTEKVEQFADSVGIPLNMMLEQLQRALGTKFVEGDTVSKKEKEALLEFLKKDHGEGEGAPLEPKKITLKRKSVSEIKVQGRKVSVVRKRRHIYGKREATPSTETSGDNVPLEQESQKEAAFVEEIVSLAPALEPAIEGESPVLSVTAPEKTAAKDQTKAKAGVTEIPVEKSDKEEKGSKIKGRGGRDHFQEEVAAKGALKPKVKEEEEKTWRQIKHIRSADVSSLQTDEGEEETISRGGARRGRSRKPAMLETPKKKDSPKHIFEKPVGPIVREVELPETITVADLAQKMSVKGSEVIKTLMQLNVMATINQLLDQDTAAMVVETLGHTPKLLKESLLEEGLWDEKSTGEALPRAPIVTVMGHVDHGKTTLLDYIRSTRVAAKEAGGITQHIGAYHVKTERGEITFLDTPGHAAFTQMRARGVQCTDIVVLVVAADDSVMPQTIEAIQHAKAGNVPIVVAINKIDKLEADLNRLQSDLSQHGLVPEAWGGDVICVPVSAKEGTGIDALLEAILLQAEILELKAPRTGAAKGVVLEARLDKGQGAVASVLVQSGTLRQGDMLLAGAEFGRVRAMINELGKRVNEVGPGMPAEVLGLTNAPQAGDTFMVVQDERKAREVADKRRGKVRDIRILQHVTLEGFFDRMQQGEMKVLSLLLKTDVQGSLEALSEALKNLSTENVKVQIISQGVGGINESDMTLAAASNAVVIGFNVRADANGRKVAEREGVDLHYYSVIYDVVNGVKRAINGLLGPEFKENILGLAEVRDVFRSAKFGAIAGCMVTEGHIKRGFPIRVLRNNVVIYQGELESLRRFKEDTSEVRQGMECGIGVKNYNDVKPGDQIEVYETVEVARTV